MGLEADLQKLEKTVNELSSGEKTLDESVELYKSGLLLVQKCQRYLQDTAQKVKMITAEDGVIKEQDFAG
ncbi:MAG: exodeoxyribonuclease VII small subunit [Candidatus Margulisbacteria bacterium]|jgi:exodeoxyribonuclease VII small subunit|nr:exodeoxyribonuclease VII small subunit [Candidatus Margulisiibacteriota bacterium]